MGDVENDEQRPRHMGTATARRILGAIEESQNRGEVTMVDHGIHSDSKGSIAMPHSLRTEAEEDAWQRQQASRAAVSEQQDAEDAEEDGYDSEEEAWGPYYWVTGERVDPGHKIWHNMKYYGHKTFLGAEFLGEVVAHFFGLHQSRYQWAIDAAAREERERKQQALEDEQRAQLAREAQAKIDADNAAALEGASLPTD